MNENLLISYSFLAALSENQSDLYKTVYLPLFRRAISRYASLGKTSGSAEDIQLLVKDEYGIEVPLLITQKLIKAVSKGLSRQEKSISKFEIYDDGKYFKFESFSFRDMEEIYNQERRNANALQKAFEEYIKSESEEDVPSFACFINKNKQKLCSFFNGQIDSINKDDIELSFMTHVDFLQEIEHNFHDLYKTAENIFMGSVIASYLEVGIELDTKLEKGIVYYLDTQIILEALDLQQEEDTRPTLELIKLIKATGGSVRILGITIAEIYKIIELSINNYDKDNPTTTINEACKRKGKNKAWLIGINGRLENYIVETLKIEKENVPERKIEEYKKTDDVTLLKETRARKSTAIHDVVAYLYVRDKRGDNTRVFQKAKSWFITANKKLHDFNLKHKVNGFVGEIIMPGELASLLFLKNPQQLSKTVSGIGLNELIAQTISEEYASKELINEFDSTIKATLELSNEDYHILLESIATQSTKKIQSLIDDSIEIENRQKFNAEIHKMIDKRRQQKNKEREDKERSQTEKASIIRDKVKISKELQEINSQVANYREEIKTEKDAKELAERKAKQLKYAIIILLALLVSIVWWVVNNIIEIPYFDIYSKVLIQTLIITVSAHFWSSKYKGQWLAASISIGVIIIGNVCRFNFSL